MEYIKVYVTEGDSWYDYVTEFLVPKMIGVIKTTLQGILRYRKLLPLGHRMRQPQEE